MLRLIVLLILLGFPSAVRAAGPHGLQPGWVVDDAAPNNNVLFTDATAQRIVDSGAGWVRINFRLARHDQWDAAILERYDTVVRTARRHGLQIVGLVGHEAKNGGQADWQANARETGGGRADADGSNAYMASLAGTAVMLMQHFRGSIRHWELWNEPNAWTQPYGVGGPFIYPSNYAYYVGRTYSIARELGVSPGVTIMTGGLFAHDIGGRDRAHATANDYIPATFAAGKRLGEHLANRPDYNWTEIKERHGTYPADAFGYHIYLDDNAEARPTDTTSIGQYLDWFRSSYRLPSAEGPYSEKPVFITELGFHTPANANPTTRAQTLQNQATSIRRTVQQVTARPWVRSCIFFLDVDNPVSNLFYGMYEADGTPKPARDAMRDAISFEGRRADGTVNDAILAKFQARGMDEMGSPVDRGRGAWVYPFVDGSEAQDFAGGSPNRLQVVGSTAGTFVMDGVFLDGYSIAGVAQALGVPVEGYGFWAGSFRQNFRRGFLFFTNGVAGPHLYGDTDGDGMIAVSDAARALRISAGLEDNDFLAAARADVAPAPAPGVEPNGVDVTDAIRIAARAAGAAGNWP